MSPLPRGGVKLAPGRSEHFKVPPGEVVHGVGVGDECWVTTGHGFRDEWGEWIQVREVCWGDVKQVPERFRRFQDPSESTLPPGAGLEPDIKPRRPDPPLRSTPPPPVNPRGRLISHEPTREPTVDHW
jgi:hypothetical protein